MLSARNVTFAAIAVAMLSVLGSLLALVGDPDSGGMAADSFGTRASGQKAIYDVLRELKLPVERSIGPPDKNWPTSNTFVIWAAQQMLVVVEPAHLHRVSDWIKSGGRVVLSSPGTSELFSQMRSAQKSPNDAPDTTVWEAIGLPNLKTQTVEVELLAAESNPQPASIRSTKEAFEGLFASTPAQSASFQIRGDGDMTARMQGITQLAAPDGKVETLLLPDDLAVKPTGTVRFSMKQDDGEEESYILAANFPMGKGQITVIADPRLLENRYLTHGDNAAFGVRLLADENRAIIWDEFYHGLTLRGNPFALLSNRAYASIAAVSLLGIALWTWRKAIWLGPATPVRPTSRRALGEYVDAMALLFARARGGRSFVLAEVREGVLWELRRRLRLSPGKEQLPLVAAALARKDRAAALELESSIAALDDEIASPGSKLNHNTIHTLQQVTACLSKSSTSAFATKSRK